MNERLLQIIQYKTGGVQTEFCALMGWSPQYLGKLLKGVNFGIVPVLAVVKTFPEINARWFLTGEGDMLDGRFDSVRSAVRSHVDRIYELERFIPVMTPAELHDFQQALSGAKKIDFSNLEEVWAVRLSQRNETVYARVRDAQKKSDELCKMKEVKK